MLPEFNVNSFKGFEDYANVEQQNAGLNFGLSQRTFNNLKSPTTLTRPAFNTGISPIKSPSTLNFANDKSSTKTQQGGGGTKALASGIIGIGSSILTNKDDFEFEPINNSSLLKEVDTISDGEIAGGAAIGAASGFAAGGPVGAAVGAIGGLVTGLMSKKKAKKANARIETHNKGVKNKKTIIENRKGALLRNSLPKAQALPFGG